LPTLTFGETSLVYSSNLNIFVDAIANVRDKSVVPVPSLRLGTVDRFQLLATT
jgi:hypothetical protein